MQFSYEEELEDFRKTAYWLAHRGWSEAAGGNMSVRIDAPNTTLARLHESDHIELPIAVPYLADKALLLTGSGTRARDIGEDVEPHVGLYKISEDGEHYGWIAGNKTPSLELPAHLAIHNILEQHRPEDKAILHTHPASLIALCHVPGFENGRMFSDKILSQQSEARLLLPEGVGFVGHELPGSLELGLKSAALVAVHHLVMWQYHGLLSTGKTLACALDKVEILEKCARIYWRLRAAGLDPDGISKQQIKSTLQAFDMMERFRE